MKIGIDARMYGPNVGGGGLGRYVEQLVNELSLIDHKNRFVLFVKDLSQTNSFKTNFDLKRANIHWYTFKEQLLLAPIIDKEKLDLVHFPHWNVPIGIKTPFVVTIHDLILLEEPRSARVTTLNPLVFVLKYAGFQKVLSHAIYASKKNIAVSNATKNDILKHFPTVNKDKITVIYEGVTPLPTANNSKQWISAPYLLHVGNCYPHKNLSALLEAFGRLHNEFQDLHLVIAGRKDIFFEKLKKTVNNKPINSFVHFEENPSDERISELYSQAKLYVFPSKIEGFGLPGLEAMSQSVPVVASNIPSLREILGDAAVFFNPNDPTSISDEIVSLLRNEDKCQELIKLGIKQTKKYSWSEMAKKTLELYMSCEN